MRTLLVAVAGLLFFSALPAHADSIDISGDVIFTRGSLTGPGGFAPGPIVESFLTNFVWNSVTNSVTDMTFTARGLLGRHLIFIGDTQENGFTSFSWENRRVIIDLLLPTGEFSSLGEFGGTKGLSLECRTARCEKDFGPTGFMIPDIESRTFASVVSSDPDWPTQSAAPGSPAPGSPILSSDPPSPVPEPASLVLLAVGLCGMALVMRRWVTKPQVAKAQA